MKRRVRNTLIVVLEHISNSLQFYLKESNLSMTKKLSICKGIGEGLNFLLQEKIIHRDMKLDNVLIDENDCPIIIDFGMAVVVNENFTINLSFDDRPGGNQSHIAPEILNSFKHQIEEPHKKEIVIDYSKQPSFEFGVICFEILCSIHPFLEYPGGYSYPYEIEDPQFIDFVNEPIPNKIKEMIIKLLKNNPNERLTIEEAISYL